ncbi:MAG: hypothetical protein RL376_21 [Verrucomicrobiota bacterium]
MGLFLTRSSFVFTGLIAPTDPFKGSLKTSRFCRVNQATFTIHSDVRFHPEVPVPGLSSNSSRGRVCRPDS